MLGLGHFVFLGVGMDLPGALGVIALLIVVQARPLGPVGGRACRVLAVVGAACMVLACGVSLAARWAEPAPPPGVEGPG